MKRALLVCLTLTLTLSACVRVRPYEREILSLRAMSLESDPYDTELDQHMIEAREGAAGGYGSAGGGCGCN